MERRLLLDVVVRERAAVLELLAGKDQALLVRRDAFLVLDLGLDVFDGVGWLDVQGDGLACQCLNENLHGVFLVDSVLCLVSYGGLGMPVVEFCMPVT